MGSSELENNSENQSVADLSRMINEMEAVLGKILVTAASNNHELCAQAEAFCVDAVRKSLASRLHLLHLQYALTLEETKAFLIDFGPKALSALNQSAQKAPCLYEEATTLILDLKYHELIASFEKQELMISAEVFEKRVNQLMQFFGNRFGDVSLSSADIMAFLSQPDNQLVCEKLKKLFDTATRKSMDQLINTAKKTPPTVQILVPQAKAAPPVQEKTPDRRFTKQTNEDSRQTTDHTEQKPKETRPKTKRFTIPPALIADAIEVIGLSRDQAKDFILKLLRYLDANASNVILSSLGPNHEAVIAKILDQYEKLHELIDSTDLAKIEPEQAMKFERKLLALMQTSASP
ncbi:MAG: hypothetical protein PHU71_00575 [Candidatus Gracilibacteria bacterium]|nr:hypothetical protein [Candidatus Gracilibacteria bacterium]